jgi:hypothetical protein
MATIEIGSQVVSISALEFNIVPTTNGNSLVFSQTKTITTQETVPNGKTWKVEGVLLDSTATTTTTSGGNTTIVSGGEKAVALSQQSASEMNMGDAMLYCDGLEEGGYDNWVVPTLEEIMFVAGGGGEVPGERTSNYLITRQPQNAGGYTQNWSNPALFYCVRLSTGHLEQADGEEVKIVRCVRHATATTNSTNGASTPSSLGAGMPTMISNESDSTMYFSQALIYCDTLLENGFSDWVLPTLDQLTYASSGGCVIDTRTSNYIWTRTAKPDNNVYVLRLHTYGIGTPTGNSLKVNSTTIYYPYDTTTGRYKNRCVR